MLSSGMFKLEPRLLEKFPFYKDECLRAFTEVYSGQYPPIQPHSWTIILRYREISDCILTVLLATLLSFLPSSLFLLPLSPSSFSPSLPPPSLPLSLLLPPSLPPSPPPPLP